jgi:hypothetical protein
MNVDATQQVKWTIYFVDGGMGTFVPLFYRFIEYIRRTTPMSNQTPQAVSNSYTGQETASAPQQFLQSAFIDPSDPTKVYLTQPVSEEQHLKHSPNYI